MKVLTATKHTQGRRKNDFCHVPQGEIVTYPIECDREKIDGRCGCRRSMMGLENLTATTTIQIVDLPLNQKQLTAAYKKSLQKSGWAAVMNDTEIDNLIKQDLKALRTICNNFPVGTILERRGSQFIVRSQS